MDYGENIMNRERAAKVGRMKIVNAAADDQTRLSYGLGLKRERIRK